MASEGFGGAEKVFVELANALAEEHQVTALLLRNATIQKRFSQKVRQIALRSNPTRNNPFLHIELYSRLKDLNPDIVHTHAAKGTALVARVNRLLGFHHLGTKHNDRKGRVFNSLPWVSVVSEKARRSIIPAKGADISVIYNGVVVEDPDPQRKDEIFTILAVGRLDRIKGFDVLIDQIAGLPFDFRLHIVGEGPEKTALERKIRANGLAEKVFLDGFHEDIPAMMKKAHLVVVSSHQEGGPKVMIEALFYADMLVATPVGAVPEVLSEMFQTEQGRLGEKIAEVYAHYDRYCEEFATMAARRREDFSFPRILENYYRLYDRIIRSANQLS
jgi:glycosyltransferase involved in cell wall biosynthesis